MTPSDMCCHLVMEKINTIIQINRINQSINQIVYSTKTYSIIQYYINVEGNIPRSKAYNLVSSHIHTKHIQTHRHTDIHTHTHTDTHTHTHTHTHRHSHVHTKDTHSVTHAHTQVIIRRITKIKYLQFPTFSNLEP